MLTSTLTILRKFDLLIIAGLFLLLTPVISMDRSIDFMIFCIFVLAYDLLYGYMGRLSFGHMLYLGVGAYALALSGEYLSGNPFVALLVALAAGAAVGLMLGPIIVRTTGACFALINLAFNQVGYFLALVPALPAAKTACPRPSTKSGFSIFPSTPLSFTSPSSASSWSSGWCGG